MQLSSSSTGATRPDITFSHNTPYVSWRETVSGATKAFVGHFINPASPTFVLVQEYQGRLPIYHFDAYRLHSEQEFAELGAAEYFEGDGVCLVEWADRVADCLPAEHLRLTLTVTGETSRRADVEGFGPRYEALARALGEAWQSAE